MTLELERCPSPVDVCGMKLTYCSLLTSLKDLYVFDRPETGNGLGDVLKILPSQLASLRIPYELLQEELDAIVLYCKRLRNLEMTYVDLNLEQFFAAVGPKLESLKLRGDCSSQCFQDVKSIVAIYPR